MIDANAVGERSKDFIKRFAGSSAAPIYLSVLALDGNDAHFADTLLAISRAGNGGLKNAADYADQAAVQLRKTALEFDFANPNGEMDSSLKNPVQAYLSGNGYSDLFKAVEAAHTARTGAGKNAGDLVEVMAAAVKASKSR